MKLTKQKKVLECFATGHYKVIDGRLCSYRKAIDQFVPLAFCTLPAGYRQVTLFTFKRNGKGIKLTVYHHIAIYLFTKGLYPEGYQIDHEDRNNQNDNPDNLVAKTPLANVLNSKQVGGGVDRPIRANEIKSIRELHAQKHSQASIARSLGLNRLSVRYTIKQIEAGKTLKYEHWTQPKY